VNIRIAKVTHYAVMLRANLFCGVIRFVADDRRLRVGPVG
jgi:hypothetical protein